MEIYGNVEEIKGTYERQHEVAATKIQRWWKSKRNDKNVKIRSWLGSLETIYETPTTNSDTNMNFEMTVYNKFVTFFNLIKQFFVSFFTK